jgi:hypothetical protein
LGTLIWHPNTNPLGRGHQINQSVIFAISIVFRFACKEINVGGYRGWRLRAVEAFIIILTFTQLLYVLLLHAGMFSSKYGPGYRDTDYGVGAGTGEPVHKGGAVPVAGARV